ncbi:MFS transporter [Lichenifustis flavocetrariae]|uniref:MFS transporter n=1 Tax=Lichenifustis flavocetrariae TaxID=2949735 RepID=A0AA41YU75_9HYPH|nr:MFS transporter [Lichenifustis flavocetrariae]MCW6508654.1 MFS transporter [Lichenifustis flavocetrariae]
MSATATPGITAAAPGDLDSAVAKARARLVPFLILMYTLAFLDRSNVGFAKQAFQADTGLSDSAFALGAGLFFVGYALFEVPSNLILHRVGARWWMARIMITWGLVSAATMFAHGETSFYILRVLLGIAEAGFFPGVILFVTFWFPRRTRGRILGLFYFGYPLSLMFGSPLSGLLLDFDGAFGLRGWQWMYLIEGIVASIVGIVAYWALSDRPEQATWLSPGERAAIAQELASEDRAKRHEGPASLSKVFTDPRMLHFTLIYFLLQIGSYGVAFYLPTQVSALLGVKVGLEVGLVSAIPWAVALAVMFFWPDLAVKTGNERLFGFVSVLAIGVGLVIAAHASPAIAIAALCLTTAGIASAQPIFWTFPTNYLGGIAAAGGIAAINSVGNLGGFFAPNLRVWAEHQFGTPVASLYALAIAAAFGAGLVLLLPRRRGTV